MGVVLRRSQNPLRRHPTVSLRLTKRKTLNRAATVAVSLPGEVSSTPISNTLSGRGADDDLLVHRHESLRLRVDEADSRHGGGAFAVSRLSGPGQEATGG